MELLAAIEFGPAALAAAFAAGVVSFISPCVLPLVPGYLSIVSGVGLGELGAQPRRVTVSTAAFVAGFGTIFVLLGAGGRLVRRRAALQQADARDRRRRLHRLRRARLRRGAAAAHPSARE